MVYLAELSVCITVRFKIVRIYARRVPRVHRQKFIDVRYFGAGNFLPHNTTDAVFC